MRKSPIWQQVDAMPTLDLVSVAHEHNKSPSHKCTMHQTLIANARAYGFRLHVFHDGAELYVVKLPLTANGGQR